MSQTRLSRRSFVQGAATAAIFSTAGVAIAAPASDNGNWDESADVVIVGAGGAGLVAGLVAAREGASVTLIDSASAVGGNTNNSSGVIQAAGTDLQKESAGVEDDTPEKHAEFYLAAGEG